MSAEAENKKLYELLRERKKAGNTVERDVAAHALLLIGNGWPAGEALEESERTLAEAELEGGL